MHPSSRLVWESTDDPDNKLDELTLTVRFLVTTPLKAC